MRPDPSLLWTWPRTIDRLPYLLTGAVLFLIKFALDWAIATFGFGQPWSPWSYLIWPNEQTLTVFELGAPGRAFAATMLVVSLPFIWTGVILTLHRLYAAGVPRGLVVLFFVPLVNLLLFAILAVLPSRAALPAHAVSRFRKGTDSLRRAHRRFVRESHWRSGLVALLITVPSAVLCVVVEAQTLQSYGLSLFVGAPFALGMFSVLTYGFSWPRPYGQCILVAMAATGLAGAAILVVALEGIICLAMAAPIAFFLSFCGATVGYVIQSRPWLSEQVFGITLAVLVTLPALLAAEKLDEPEPQLREVRTVQVIDASPEVVWDRVISFPPLPEPPDDWLFRCGVAYPVRAEIDGRGPGAVRRCVFSTGAFVEPIEVWDAPNLLRFQVTDQPEPMREWSPYAIHPPHLDNFLVSRQGEFRLHRLPDGRTRLEGTTWYTNRMWPSWYWGLWSDHIIHQIHGRVLRHIAQLAEGER
jgi:hypothetical protein